ncbi:protein of unknown function [Pseudomonas sp. JV551A1]|uniref:Uncharacterized protein n=1 Tax=Pseudomonas inefficax TaxID=2078786 RepID=A0AAQ1P4W2_9PSED|nr:protein of unknown function [Pseudomonas sp. JV551A1]SPO59931.1 protein of unknown function [Pseudomonas inefficax]
MDCRPTGRAAEVRVADSGNALMGLLGTPVGAALCRDGLRSSPRIQLRRMNCRGRFAALSRHKAAPTRGLRRIRSRLRPRHP